MDTKHIYVCITLYNMYNNMFNTIQYVYMYNIHVIHTHLYVHIQ